MKQFEASTTINATPKKIFSIYTDVQNWPQWDPDAKSATIDGAFVSGATGVVVPHGGPTSKIAFQNVVQNKGFSVLCKLPLCKMRFEYELHPLGEQTKAIHRVVFTGLLAPVFNLLIGSGMKKSIPKGLESLRALAQSA